MEKSQKNSSYKGLWCIFLLMAMLLIPSVSALEFDNVKSYDAVTREVTIKNAFGLGADIGKARLNTPLNVVVGQGYQKVAEFDLSAYQDYNDALKQFSFEDMKDGRKKINREYDLKYKTYEDVVVDDYETKCYIDTKSLNKTAEVCEQIKIGEHYEKQEVWKKVSPADLKKNDVLTIGVFTDVKAGDYVDWKPIIYGVEVKEWATWTESLNTNLISYWTFDETSGTTGIDSLGVRNFTYTGATPNRAGKIGKAVDFDGTNDYANTTSTLNLGTGAFTIAGWWYADATGNNILFFNLGYDNSDSLWLSQSGTTYYNIQRVKGGSNTGLNTGVAVTSGSWKYLTLVRDGTTLRFYIDGISVYNNTNSDNNMPLNYPLQLGYGYPRNIGIYFNGGVDELGAWTRALSGDEIAQLYNGGDGITCNAFDVAPSITLNSPTTNANYSTSPQSFVFNFTALDDINLTDVKLYVNGVLNQTNASGINNSVYLFDLDLGDGTWIVKGIATDNASLTANSSSVTFVIDSARPQTFVSGLNDLQVISMPTNSTWSFNATDPHIDKCYYNATGIATTLVTCNSTITSTQWATGGIKSLTYCANDTFGNANCTTTSLNVYDFVVTQSGATAIGEGGIVTFGLNVTSTSFPIGDANAVFYWNGTNQGVTTKTIESANKIRFLETFSIPDGAGNTTGFPYSWNWIYNATNLASRNSTTQTQSVYAVDITDCAVTSGYVILNLSLKDEETNTLVNVTAPNVANVEIDLTITSIDSPTMTWDFSKSWTNNSHAVCVPVGLLNETDYQIDFVIGYDSTDRMREFYYLENGTLDLTGYFNSYTSKNVSLMDLLSADSTTFLFEYSDENNQKVDDIIIHTFRKYIGEGLFREVERSKQDNAGQTHVHLVEEDVIYYFMITQYGEILFTSDTYNAKCLSTPCEISLSASATEQNWSIIDNEGGNYVVTSDKATRTITTTFNLDTISLVNASLYKMANMSGVPELVNSSSLTATSGSIDFYVPLTYENTTYFVSVYKDNEFIKSSWVSMTEDGKDYFGTFGALLGGFIVLAMMLMAVTEGAGFIVVTILALVIIGVMQLVDLGWMAIISIICAGGIIIWKLINRRGTRQ